MLEELKYKFPNLSCYNNINEGFEKDYDGYIIATPPSTHTKLTKSVISIGKPVLVEKPLALSLDECSEIKRQIKIHEGRLIVGHLLLFHPAIIKMKRLIDEGKIGNIQYMYSNRLNLGTVRSHENVFWSFAPHDISIFQFFSNSFPSKVLSIGADILQKEIHDTTITYLKYPNNIQGHIYVSWLHPFKEHRLVIIGTKGTLHFDDSNQNKPLLFYEKDKSIDANSLELKNEIPKKIKYDSTMPLENELKYFFEVIKGKKIDKASIDEGIDVIKILEIASKAIGKEL